jgi:hypothetical protein
MGLILGSFQGGSQFLGSFQGGTQLLGSFQGGTQLLGSFQHNTVASHVPPFSTLKTRVIYETFK